MLNGLQNITLFWLSKKFAGIINSKFDGSYLRFYLLGIMLLELKLIEDKKHSKSTAILYITGILTKKRSWLVRI